MYFQKETSLLKNHRPSFNVPLCWKITELFHFHMIIFLSPGKLLLFFLFLFSGTRESRLNDEVEIVFLENEFLLIFGGRENEGGLVRVVDSSSSRLESFKTGFVSYNCLNWLVECCWVWEACLILVKWLMLDAKLSGCSECNVDELAKVMMLVNS